jgi:hypothetical protein
MKDGGSAAARSPWRSCLVAGAQQHLSLKKTQIVIGGTPYRLTDNADGSGFDELPEIAAAEERARSQGARAVPNRRRACS